MRRYRASVLYKAILAASLLLPAAGLRAETALLPPGTPQKPFVLVAEGGPSVHKESGRIGALKPGTMLAFGEALENGKKGRTVFRWRDGVSVSAGEQALAVLSSEGPGSNPVRILIPALGSFGIFFKRLPADRMKIRTFAAEIEPASEPAALTLFAGSDGTTFASVTEGSFSFEPLVRGEEEESGSMTVRAGGHILISLGGAITASAEGDDPDRLFGPERTAWSAWNRVINAKLSQRLEAQRREAEARSWAQAMFDAYERTEKEYRLSLAEYQAASEQWRASKTAQEQFFPAQERLFRAQDRHRELAAVLASAGRLAELALVALFPEDAASEADGTKRSQESALLEAVASRLEAVASRLTQ